MAVLVILKLLFQLFSISDMSTLRLDALAAPSSSAQVTVVNPLSSNVLPGQMTQAQISAQPLPIDVGYSQRVKYFTISNFIQCFGLFAVCICLILTLLRKLC